jgi:hypothetical protein
MPSPRDPADPRDDYERTFVGPLAEKSPDAKVVVDDCLRLFDRVFPSQQGPIRAALTEEFQARMVRFLQRSFFINDLDGHWGAMQAVKAKPTLFNPRNAVHVFGALLLQQIEGPLKTQLAFLCFLLELDHGDNATWPDYVYVNRRTGRQKTFGHFFERGARLAERYPDLRGMFRSFRGGPERLDFDVLRNALGHSDYIIIGKGQDIRVTLEAGERTQVMEANEFLSIVSGMEDLIRALNVAILIFVHRMTPG